MVNTVLSDSRIWQVAIFISKRIWLYTMVRIIKSKLYLLLLLTFIFLSACSSATKMEDVPSEAVCSSIIDVKCVKCHYKTRICDALGTKSIRKWQKTIKLMTKQGAQLTEEEKNKVIACLSSLPAGSKVVCQ